MGTNYRLDAIGNGDRLYDAFGGIIRYRADTGTWMVWDTQRWVEDTGQVQEASKEIVADLYKEAVPLWRTYELMTEQKRTEEAKQAKSRALAYDGWARTTAGNLFKVAQVAGSMPDLQATSATFDAHPYLLNTPDGVLDLRTGQVDDHLSSLMLTKLTAASPAEGGWRGGIWEQFLNYVLGDPDDPEGAKEQQAYLRRMMGCTAIGDAREKAMAIPIGPSNTGKSMFLNTVEYALGDYAVHADTDLFLVGGGPKYGLADLEGARLVVMSEFSRKDRINVSRLKNFVGAEPFTARQINQKPKTFTPVGTLWISTNEAPYFGADEAAFSRLHMFGFTKRLAWAQGELPDHGLPEMLREAAPEVLAWLVQGAQEYLAEGLNPPQANRDMVSELEGEQQHHILDFARERLVFQEGSRVFAGPLRLAYVAWCEMNGYKPESAKAAAPEFKKLGLESRPSTGNKPAWFGAHLQTESASVWGEL